MGVSTYISIIGVCISAFSVAAVIYFNQKGNKRTDTKEFEERVRENTRINMKLDNISSNTNDIKNEVSSIREEMKSHDGRIIRVEESAKQAHHRLDSMEEKLNALEVKHNEQ